MKKFAIFFLILLPFQWCYSGDFVRNLPDKKLISLITAENFPTEDAVIILKEQSYRVERATVDYRQYEILGLQTVASKIIIVKMLNENAVNRYGTFEYIYYERYGRNFPCGYDLHARILKGNGKIIKIKKKEIKNIVIQRDNDNIPLYRKVICKFPSLSVGDVLQIEFHLTKPFTYSSDKIFYYNDRDLVLYSNLYITFPRDLEADYLSFPSDKVGEPQVVQVSKTYGSGKTYFWSLRNLASIPDEPYSRPFSDRSKITTFVLHNKKGESKSWFEVTKNFYDRYLNKDAITANYLAELGLDTIRVTKDSITFDLVEQVYYVIRKTLKLHYRNYILPNSDDIKSIFEQKGGRASDLAYIFLKILKQWGADAKAVFIRDRREGIFEETVPSLNWFSRIGVYVTVNGIGRIYDFDRAIPYHYTMPWFLNGITYIIFDDTAYKFKKCASNLNYYKKNKSYEFHKINLDGEGNFDEKVTFSYTGSASQKLRDELYDINSNDASEVIKAANLNNFFEQLDSLHINDFLESNDITLTCFGKTTLNIENIGTTSLIKLDCHLLKNFREEIFSVVRRSDYYFDSPFQISSEWQIPVPQGYKISDDVLNRKPLVKFLGKINAKVVHSFKDNIFSVRLDLKFPSADFPCKKHGELITLLDSILDYIEKDISIEKI
ncbi:MAG: DUF3857 domain-containing protein [Promethearchaeota archaeon]